MYKKLPLKCHWKISNTNIYVFETENILKLKVEKEAILSKYAVGLSKITSIKKQEEFIATRIAHHFIFNHKADITYKNSAPHFCESYSLSVSHSNGHIALAYNKLERIGIDLEMESTRIERIAHKILHPEEELYKNQLESDQRQEYLNKIWTTKEACYKACHTNTYAFKQYKTVQLFGENPRCEILQTKENFKLYFKRLEKFYFCLAILS